MNKKIKKWLYIKEHNGTTNTSAALICGVLVVLFISFKILIIFGTFILLLMLVRRICMTFHIDNLFLNNFYCNIGVHMRIIDGFCKSCKKRI